MIAAFSFGEDGVLELSSKFVLISCAMVWRQLEEA